MRQRTLIPAAIVAALAVAASAAPGALGDATDDYNAVATDYAAHNKAITHCRFSPTQLQNARQVAQTQLSSSYGDGDPRFVPAVDAELAYQRRNGCPLPPGNPPRGSRLRLAVSPTTAKVGRRTTFAFTVSGLVRGRRVGVKDANVRFAGTTKKTDRHGRASIAKTFARTGRQTASAAKRGLKSATASVRVRRR